MSYRLHLGIVLTMVAVGCGGEVLSDGLTTPAPDGGASDDAAVSISGGGTGVGGGSGSGSGSTGVGTPGGTSTGTGVGVGTGPSGGFDGGAPTDGGVIVVDASRPDTATVAKDAGGDDSPIIIGVPDSSFPFDGGFSEDAQSTAINCGTTTCNSATEQCCLGFNGTASCVAEGEACPGGGLSLSCTGSSNCSDGEVCCGNIGGGSASATCQPSCGGGGGFGGGGLQLCNSDADCPTNETCRDTPFGISLCRPQHGGGGPGGPGGGTVGSGSGGPVPG
jgi:hypothetical protein